jgi:hypothetical protein
MARKAGALVCLSRCIFSCAVSWKSVDYVAHILRYSPSCIILSTFLPFICSEMNFQSHDSIDVIELTF